MKTPITDPMFTPTATKESNSLYDSLMNVENERFKDETISAIARRVGMVLKVADSRKLHLIYTTFVDRIDSLIRETCSSIDNELHTTEED